MGKYKDEIWEEWKEVEGNKVACRHCSGNQMERHATRCKAHTASCLSTPQHIRDKYNQKVRALHMQRRVKNSLATSSIVVTPSVDWPVKREMGPSDPEELEVAENIDPMSTYEPPSPQEYDGVFVSSAVSEKKRFLWEIKDFEDIMDKGVMKAMHFEFEMGRLGSLEKHLPRKSKWRVSLDSVGQDPELILRLLFPDDKVICYKFFAQIMDGPDQETNVSTRRDGTNQRFREASSKEVENRFSLRPDFGEYLLEWSLRSSISMNQSLFIKIEMEVIEDSSA